MTLPPHNNLSLLVSDSLYEGRGQTARVVSELTSAGWAVQHPAPAGLADDVTCGAAGDGQVPGDDQAHRALHHRLQVTIREGSVGSDILIMTWTCFF